MKKYFKRNILDELYELKGDEFADNILKEMAKQNKELGSLEIEEQLTEKIKQAIPNEKLQREVLELLNKYELEVGNDDDFWNKMYYKLGAYDCVKMKNIVQPEVKDEENKEVQETKTVFFDEYSDELFDYLNTNRVRVLKENAEYKELEIKREKIKAENPNVRTFLEDREAVELTDVELNAVLDIFEIEGDIETIETIETFKLGAREMLLFLKQMRLL